MAGGYEANARDVELDVRDSRSSNITTLAQDQRSQANTTQTSTLLFTLLTLALLIIVIGLGAHTVQKLENDGIKVTTAYPSAGFPTIADLSWDDVVKRAAGSSIKFWMADTNPSAVDWVDNWLAPLVLDKFGVTLTRPCKGGSCALNAVDKLTAESNAGIKQGEVDLIWINGENFKRAKQNNLLYGPWARLVPNAANFDFNAPQITTDFGEPTDGYEIPFNQAQYVFIYNRKFVDDKCTFSDATPTCLPQTMDELVRWVLANPGRFTYAQPLQADGKSYDFTGSAFIRHFLYFYGGPYTDMLGPFNQPLYNPRAAKAFAALRRMEPALAKVNGTTYPTAQGMIDEAFAKEEVWITASYQVTFAGRQVSLGKWPNTTMAYVPRSGSIQNTNFIAIGKTSSHIPAALVVANAIAEISAMFKRRQPEGWGAIQAYNPNCNAMINGGWKTAFEYLKYFPQTPPVADLRNRGMSELVAAYTTQMQSDWITCVVAYASNMQTAQCVDPSATPIG